MFASKLSPFVIFAFAAASSCSKTSDVQHAKNAPSAPAPAAQPTSTPSVQQTPVETPQPTTCTSPSAPDFVFQSGQSLCFVKPEKSYQTCGNATWSVVAKGAPAECAFTEGQTPAPNPAVSSNPAVPAPGPAPAPAPAPVTAPAPLPVTGTEEGCAVNDNSSYVGRVFPFGSIYCAADSNNYSCSGEDRRWNIGAVCPGHLAHGTNAMKTCTSNGKVFPTLTYLCFEDKKQYLCNDGTWQSTSNVCK